jgi:hypothetical protein
MVYQEPATFCGSSVSPLTDNSPLVGSKFIHVGFLDGSERENFKSVAVLFEPFPLTIGNEECSASSHLKNITLYLTLKYVSATACQIP